MFSSIALFLPLSFLLCVSIIFPLAISSILLIYVIFFTLILKEMSALSVLTDVVDPSGFEVLDEL